MARPTVFISYSHHDEVWKDRLVTHLGVLSHQGLLDQWNDRCIGPGEDWHQEIQEAVVLAREDQPELKRLVAYLVPTPHAEPSAGHLRSYLAHQLPDYMIPGAFVLLDTRGSRLHPRALGLDPAGAAPPGPTRSPPPRTGG